MELYFHEVDGDVTIIAVDGGLDSGTLDAFTEQVEKIVDTGINRLILDCTRLTFISSAAIARLLVFSRRMKEIDGDVKLASVHGPVFKVLHLMRLDTVLGVYDDVDRARAAFRDEAAGGA